MAAVQKVIALTALSLVAIPLLMIVHSIDTPNDTLPSYRIEQFRFVESDSASPPKDVEWLELGSGDMVRTTVNRDRFNSSWVAFEVEPADEPLALYMPAAQANVAVYVGDSFVGSSAPMERPLAFFMRPLLFPLPMGSGGRNDTTVFVRIAREGGFLTPNAMYVAPADLLTQEWRAERLVTLWVPAIVATAMLALTLSLVVIYLLGRNEYSYYGIFAVIVTLWSLHTIQALVDRIPFEHWSWFSLAYLTLWWTMFGPAFANRFFNLGMPRLVRGVIALGVLLTLPIPYFLAQFEIGALYSYYSFVWVPWTLVCALIAWGQYGIASWRRWDLESLGMFTMSAIAIVVGIRDHLFDFADWMPGTMYYTQFVGMMAIGLMAWFIARRHVRSGRELAALNAELEQRVGQKARELEEGYDERSRLEQAQTLSRERERLMRDMHDGLGGQLIQALAISENRSAPSELHDSLSNALDDLRMIVDSLAPEQSRLIPLLASFRHRNRRLWESADVNLVWQMGDVPDAELGPERALNLLRIVQEATSNALRHSGATEVRISTDTNGDAVLVSIADNGSGFDKRTQSAGLGLDNMQKRASQSSLGLNIESTEAGTVVRITLHPDLDRDSRLSGPPQSQPE